MVRDCVQRGFSQAGLGIRFAVMDFFRHWLAIEREGSSPEREQSMRRTYVRATSVLVLL